MGQRQTIFIIMGSVRKNRICPDIAEWVAFHSRSVFPGAEFEIIDLRAWPLAMDDEPGIPAHSGYASDSTKAWSEKINEADGFIFLSPQYNWGYPAALKNAIDHLYHEWRNKPAIIVSYGGHGGGKAAIQLSQVLQGLKMRTVPQMPALTLSKEIIESNSGTVDASVIFSNETDQVRDAVKALSALFIMPK